jgi:predicted ATPase/DNA-binding CsgD family transcriptional regulator
MTHAPSSETLPTALSRLTLTHPRHNLPALLTSFVNRDAERAMVLARLRDPACRLVTIAGAGGVGKTRLALEAAAQLIPGRDDPPRFAHGVYLVSLVGLNADEALATSIASALGIGLSGPNSATIQVRNYLREKAMLLVLDNFEHLLSEAPYLSDLLQAGPELTLLVTSRERLNLRGEWVVELDGLAFPADRGPKDGSSRRAVGDARSSVRYPAPSIGRSATELEQYSAVQLFVQTARTHTPELDVNAGTAPAIARICRLVGGLPLGIELAASWTRFLSCTEIADELDQTLDFLTSDSPDVPERQQSMRAVFASSWRLLTATEQQALRQLSIFQGSFSREAARLVASAPLPQLASLVNKSLVRRVTIGPEDAAHYEIPEPLRQYAAEELERSGEAADVADRHAAYYMDMLEARTSDLRGPAQPEALASLTAQIAQVRAAWRRTVDQNAVDRLGRAANGLFHLYDMRSWFGEGAEAFGIARAMIEAQPQDDNTRLVLAKMLAREGWFVFHGGRQREAQSMLARSLALLRGLEAGAELVWALNYLAAVCSYLGEYRTTETLCQESLALADRIGDVYGRVIALSVLCQTAYEHGDYTAAKAWGEQSLALEQQVGSRWSMAYSLLNLGKVAHALGEHTAARQLFEQTLQIRQALGDIRGVAICHNRLGETARALGDDAEAGARYAESLVLFREIGNQWGIAAVELNLGRLALAHGAEVAAVRLLHEALVLALETGSAPQVAAIVSTFAQLVQRSGQRGWSAELHQLSGDESEALDRYQLHAARLRAWSAAEAAAMSLDQAVATACTPPRDPQPPVTQPPAAQPANLAGLTAREVEVLRLVAQGLTDAQVAEQLVVSRRTVQAHLSSVYGKLEIHSRSAATRFAVERGLV